MVSINRLLLEVVVKGANRLSPEARESVRGYVRSRELASGGFMDRAGKADVYYTFFGLLSSLALGININKGHGQFLESIDIDNLDLPDKAAYIQSLSLIKLFDLPKGIRINSAFSFVDKKSSRSPGNRYVLSDESIPYDLFLAIQAYNIVTGDSELKKWLKSGSSRYRTKSGGWTNVADGEDPSLNATVAGLMVLKHVGGEADTDAINWIKSQQHPSGGFFAVPLAPLPDLLSTATALMALRVWGEEVASPVVGFIHSHWRENGGFAAVHFDEETDCEYTFYGLLALGAGYD